MKIDGKILAAKIIEDIKKDVANLSKKGITLKVAIVTLGPEAAWENYVSRKIKLAKDLGIEAQLINIKDPTERKLIETIERLNNDSTVTGIIVQRPLTRHIKEDKVTYAVSPKKDIDGFIKDAYFKTPVWLAIKDLLLEIAKNEKTNFENFLVGKSITVLGKGETAGMPVIDGFRKMEIEPNVVDSKTENAQQIIQNSDIIISAVGKPEMFKAGDLKNGAIIIAIGLHREDGKLKPDFDEKEISKVAKYYTPTPGGIGPLNLAYLFKNLVNASKI